MELTYNPGHLQEKLRNTRLLVLFHQKSLQVTDQNKKDNLFGQLMMRFQSK